MKYERLLKAHAGAMHDVWSSWDIQDASPGFPLFVICISVVISRRISLRRVHNNLIQA